MRPILPIVPKRFSLLPYTASNGHQLAVSGNYLLGFAAVERPSHLFSSQISPI
jgi:hypothetical protein